MAEKKPVRAAIVYDFDGTLSPGSMQEHALIPDLGYANPEVFWEEARQRSKARDGDEILTYMQMILQASRQPVSAERLEAYGATLPLFDGVTSWFARMDAYARERGLALEHYVISSGLHEMIEGCSIFPCFKKVFASRYHYEDGRAVWPAVVINYTTKTQFLFRINKGIDNTWDNDRVNLWVPMDERDIPFERMIFIGDGITDIPCMKMIRQLGGISIAVFDEKKWSRTASRNRIHRLISEDRANFIAAANYCDGSLLDVTVRGVLGRIARIAAHYRPTD